MLVWERENILNPAKPWSPTPTPLKPQTHSPGAECRAITSPSGPDLRNNSLNEGWGLESGVQGIGFTVERRRAKSSGFEIQGVGFRGLGLRTWGVGG